MPADFDNGPFGIGKVENGVNADSNPVLRHWLGRRRDFHDLDYSVTGLTSGRSLLSGNDLSAICLRNNSGITLIGKQLAMVTQSGRDAVKNIAGYGNRNTSQGLVVVDPWLPATGVPNGYLFWGFVKGVLTVKTPLDGATFNGDIAAMAPLVCVTETATTGGTTAGRACGVTLAGQTAATASVQVAAAIIGRALSARTTGETNADLLALINMPWIQ